jgi:hypothetical protein
MSSEWEVHELLWTFDPPQPLSVFTERKLRVNFEAISKGAVNVAAKVQIAAARAILRVTEAEVETPVQVYETTGIVLPPSGGSFSSPLPPLSTFNIFITGVPATIEVFSAGSLESEGDQPSNPALTFSVVNNSEEQALVQVDVAGTISSWIEPSLVHILESGESQEFSVYLAVGSAENLFPEETETGLIRVVITSVETDDIISIVRWFYRGVD